MHLAEFNACVRGYNAEHGVKSCPTDAEHDALIEKYG